MRVYEYTPGFLHSKSVVVDDEAAVVGTINMDYRSLCLHFENACLFIGGEIVAHVRDKSTRPSGPLACCTAFTMRSCDCLHRCYNFD